MDSTKFSHKETPPISKPHKVTTTAHYNLRSRNINPQAPKIPDNEKPLSTNLNPKPINRPTIDVGSADKNFHYTGEHSRPPRPGSATPPSQKVTFDQDTSPHSQSTPDSPVEDCQPCAVTPPGFGTAPTTKRPRGVEHDYDEGNLTKTSKVELTVDDEMDYDCDPPGIQVLDSGFIHSLSLV